MISVDRDADRPRLISKGLPSSRASGTEGGLDRKMEHGDRGGVRGGRGLLVLDEIAELGIVLIADRCLQRDRRLGEVVLRRRWRSIRLVGAATEEVTG